ncbi:MAG: endonuclease III [Thermodesulfobacteriota bacterium]
MVKVKRILEILEREYPDARLVLEFKTPLQLLIATILAAQCTDERINQVTTDLFKKYQKAEDYTNVSIDALEEDIHSTGFYKNKAKNIAGCCKKIIKDFNGEVPSTLPALVSLPGVGRKTANIVLANAFGKPAIGVDTHVQRVSNRLGLAHSNNPDKVEMELCNIIPEGKWIRTVHLLTFHGKRICKAKRPLCGQCILFELCEWPDKERSCVQNLLN